MTECLNRNMREIMSRIIEVRYTDLEQELRLCEELLACAQIKKDSYATAYALTYMGDYYIAAYDAKKAGMYLTEAEELLQREDTWAELKLRLYSLLGIYYEMRTDEQSAIEYYLEAIAVAEKLQDWISECVALNNLAFVFQRHRCLEEAFQYYEKAYQIQEDLDEMPIRTTLLMNLAEIAVATHRFKEAKSYILKCELAEKDELQREVVGYKNWCGYYAAMGDKERALAYGDRYLEKQEVVNLDKLTDFEAYHTLWLSMMDLGAGAYAKRFLDAMDYVCNKEELDQIKVLEETSIQYTLRFEPPEKHPEAYQRFFKQNMIFRTQVDEAIANAMKSRIRLAQLMRQTHQMHSHQESLEQEVNRDELTGLYCRVYIDTLMRGYEEETTAGSLGIIILDVDYFKEYNDYYGHMRGDTALQEIASCLAGNVCATIYPCRYGGDEFLCICEDTTEAEVEDYIERVRDCLHAKAIPHEKSYCAEELTLSIGYVLEERTQVEGQMLLQLADQALYQSKRCGRNRYTRKRVEL